MEALTAAKNSILGLFKALTGDTRLLVRQELQLFKTELSEKISKMGRNAAVVAVGGFTVYAGLILFLFGLGWLLGWAFALAGLQPMFASFLGFAAIGLLVVGAGGVLLLKAIKALSQESLAPERTFETLEDLVGGSVAHAKPEKKSSEKPSSEELQERVETTEHRMKEHLGELKHRLNPIQMKTQVTQGLQAHPYQAGLVAMGAGLLSGLVLRRRFKNA
ncbi:MAG: hypothetical protein C5B50_29140 [Verrucomicrobia bacterium]|nr:MAG: hypothetical protein C5B50_29140 [Verrucomicrobiota bacterium]